MLTVVNLTVLFQEPFWIGVFEIQEGYLYRVSKVTFGTEPKDIEIQEFILKSFYRLNFSCESHLDVGLRLKKINPKRQQRQIKSQIKENGIGTKAQEALKKEHEMKKQAKRKNNSEEKLLDEKRRFEIKKAKRKEKHRGH